MRYPQCFNRFTCLLLIIMKCVHCAAYHSLKDEHICYHSRGLHYCSFSLVESISKSIDHLTRNAWVSEIYEHFIADFVILFDLSSELRSLLKLQQTHARLVFSQEKHLVSIQSPFVLFAVYWNIKEISFVIIPEERCSVYLLINATVIAYMVSRRSICLVERAGWRQSCFVKSSGGKRVPRSLSTAE